MRGRLLARWATRGRMGKVGLSSRAWNAALLVALAALALASVQFVRVERRHQRLRQDLAELDDIDYGMLDADAWVRQVVAIVNKDVSAFRLTPERRKELKPILERALDAFLTQLDAHLRGQAHAGGLGARFKEGVRERLIPVGDLKSGIPGYADAILDQMDSPESRKQLQHAVRHTLHEATRGTRSRVDPRRLEAVHQAYGCEGHDPCGERIRDALAENGRQGKLWAAVVAALALALLVGGAVAARRRTSRTPLAVLTLGSACLLACGVLTPMIDVEARVSKLSFLLLGQEIEFHDQVLYFQSKSVLDVVRALFDMGKPEIVGVGILLTTFSVIFPLCKMLASFLYIYDVRRLRGNAVVEFFALKSSKWSMADVFVIAMFMAYIGFDGIANSELEAFKAAAGPDIHVMTFNGSGLQLGYFMFLAFCLAGLVTSQIVKTALEDGERAGRTRSLRRSRALAVPPPPPEIDELPAVH